MQRAAMRLTAFARHKWAHHGSVVVKGGKPQSFGYNHGTTHAEVMALSKLWPSKRRGTTVWSIRMTRSGKLASARPCPECMAYLIEFGVKTVYYSDESGDIQMIRL